MAKTLRVRSSMTGKMHAFELLEKTKHVAILRCCLFGDETHPMLCIAQKRKVHPWDKKLTWMRDRGFVLEETPANLKRCRLIAGRPRSKTTP